MRAGLHKGGAARLSLTSSTPPPRCGLITAICVQPLGAARHTQYVPAGCGGAAEARGGALPTQEAGFRYRSLSPVIVASGPQVSLSLSGGAISAGHTIQNTAVP